MNNDIELIIHDLINKSLDGSITSSEFEELNRLIKSDPECAAYYVSSIRIHQAFSKAGRLFREHTGEALSDSGLSLQEFAEYEKIAPVIPIAKAKAVHEQQRDAAQTVPVRKISKFPVITVIASCAALLMIFVYVYLNPQAVEVATLVDSINAQWDNPEDALQIGSRLLTSRKPIVLQQGIIKVLYDNDVEVLLEAPAEFQIQSAKEIALKAGSLFSKVTPAGKGFSVITPQARIVDLGTEFGVSCDAQNKTQLHVFKGKTTLAARADKTAKTLGVLEGQAREIEAAGSVKDIQVKQELFVRHILSAENCVWRGEPLDLANLASGGDGLSTWGSTLALDPQTGLQTQREHIDRTVSNVYVPVSWSRYIDGVFVPNGASPQVVTSQGHLFAECPSTNGVFCTDIILNQASSTQKTSMVLKGISYGYPGHSGIFMHANLGLTFNLDHIRSLVPADSNLVFCSKIGVSEVETPRECDADFWVLVDGKVRYQKRNVKIKGLCDEIEVKLFKEDRFLTLVTTDGGTIPAAEDLLQTDSDWCLFGEPRIEIE